MSSRLVRNKIRIQSHFTDLINSDLETTFCRKTAPTTTNTLTNLQKSENYKES